MLPKFYRLAGCNLQDAAPTWMGGLDRTSGRECAGGPTQRPASTTRPGSARRVNHPFGPRCVSVEHRRVVDRRPPLMIDLTLDVPKRLYHAAAPQRNKTKFCRPDWNIRSSSAKTIWVNFRDYEKKVEIPKRQNSRKPTASYLPRLYFGTFGERKETEEFVLTHPDRAIEIIGGRRVPRTTYFYCPHCDCAEENGAASVHSNVSRHSCSPATGDLVAVCLTVHLRSARHLNRAGYRDIPVANPCWRLGGLSRVGFSSLAGAGTYRCRAL